MKTGCFLSPFIDTEDAMVCIFNLQSISQAGRHGFESRLPLQEINHLQAPCPVICSFLLLNPLYDTLAGRSSAGSDFYRGSCLSDIDMDQRHPGPERLKPDQSGP
jgi:hypothetical protein